MSENKDEILANFQSITGIDDIGEAFSHLEEAKWDLMVAIQRVIPQDDTPILHTPTVRNTNATPPTSTVGVSASLDIATPTVLNDFSNIATTSNNCRRWDSNGSAVDSVFAPVPSTSKNANIIDLGANMGTVIRKNDIKSFIFNIHFNQQVFTIVLPSNATIENLKNQITDTTKVPICRQALRGWPPAKLQEAQKSSTKLSSLGLSAENELILIDMTNDGFMDYETDENVQQFEQKFTLTIVEQPSGKKIELTFPGYTTIQDVKMNVYDVTNIPVRHQEWSGWPHGCDNTSTLSQSGIELNHNFILQNSNRTQNNGQQPSTSERAVNTNTTATTDDTESSADEEFEDASDFNACEEFFTDSPPVQPPSRHLIPDNADNETAGCIEFSTNYVERFGEPHPLFYTGSLDDALKEACNKPARDRKLLAIYLHHGESILTNVFCDHLMKHESIIQTFEQNFIVYGWDLTFESNKYMLLSSLTACVGNTASLTVRNIPIDKLPSILVIGRSRLSGRTSCEVLSVIHGNVGLDDLLSRLLEAVELYNQHLQVEIREEDERAARDQVKAEQDMAYQETLQADMAKEAAKVQKEAAIAAERQRLESEKAEEDARRESIRMIAEQSLPEEPSESEANITKIRIRKPTGDFLERRFYVQNTLQDLLNFVASSGFLVDEFKVLSSWPRRDLTSTDGNQTLQSLKLYPQETVILEER